MRNAGTSKIMYKEAFEYTKSELVTSLRTIFKIGHCSLCQFCSNRTRSDYNNC